MTTATDIRVALEAEKPAIVREFVDYICDYWAGFVAEFGDDGRKYYNSGGHSSWSNEGRYFNQRRGVIHGFTRRRETTGNYYGVVYLDDAVVAKEATEYADRIIGKMVAKLESKTGGLSEVEVLSVSPGALEISLRGKRGEDLVKIEQRRIRNTSSLGDRFNQYPSLIYVNGKKTSEAAFKRAA